MNDERPLHEAGAVEPEWIALVRGKLRDLRFGVVQLVVHDGRVTQIELTEKVRLPSREPTGSRPA